MIPPSVMRSNKQQTNSTENEHSPKLKNSHEDPATKKFEEELALLDATSSKLTMNNWDHTSGSEEDEKIEKICRMNNATTVQFKFNRTQNVPLKTSPASNDMMGVEDDATVNAQPTKKKRLYGPDEPANDSTVPTATDGIDQVKSK